MALIINSLNIKYDRLYRLKTNVNKFPIRRKFLFCRSSADNQATNKWEMHKKRSKQVRIRTSTLPYLVAREKLSATKREIDWKES